MTNLEPFGTYLRRKRIQLDLTQEDLAKRGQLSQQYISNVESSADTERPITPTPKTLKKIADGLGVTLAEVERAAHLQPGAVESRLKPRRRGPSIPPGATPVTLATGDVVYLSPDDQEPEKTIIALEAWIRGWRARQAPTDE